MIDMKIKFLDKLSPSVVPLRSSIRSLFIFKIAYTPRRIWNLIKIISSMLLSKILRRQIVWGYPSSIMIEPTNICNLRCPMCPSGNGDMLRPKGQLDYDSFKKLLDEVGPYISQIQLWNQGEPFINKNLLEFIRYAKTKGVMTQTSTNGHFIRSDEAAEEVVRSGLDQIIFSMDGTNQETYEKYRVGGDYQLVFNTLGRLSRAKDSLRSRTPLIELQFIVFKHNQHGIDELIAIAKQHKVNRLAFKTAQIYSGEQGSTFLPEDANFLRYQFDGKNWVMKGELKNWCKRLWINPAVNWDGTVSPCCFDKDSLHAFPGLFENNASFSQIWKSPGYMTFRRLVMTRRSTIAMCRNCTESLKEPYVRIIDL